MLRHILQIPYSGAENPFNPAPTYFLTSSLWLARQRNYRQTSPLSAICALLHTTFVGPEYPLLTLQILPALLGQLKFCLLRRL